ncbi:hypothetical protein NUU61_008733 [Penicillium alfredii]|uniref:Protein kinase domain-containing protein n=1 Tax=Penicillium alfredii TaxID=1506179 RepID=A0A9W9EM00_9EURO|nr:uncharacterized protein NUU61_008733 [Penicillium alfredii]KAJ5084154.1 hypothetical protein NUU61_008733 [Penicillium alfredii]
MDSTYSGDFRYGPLSSTLINPLRNRQDVSPPPRGRGGFLQRRLTKLYTDTKTSCESVTTASKALDDPELVALHQSFQKQRDRLLTWGLDWSDASAAQPNDIDESLTAAGFSDVVESVMSSIQDLLNDAERVQHADAPILPSKERKVDLPSKDTLGSRPLKTQWTDDDISRSKTILNDLTGCIDTLYDLSRSRRTMASSMSSSRHSATARRPRATPTSPYDSSHDSFSESKEKVQSPKQMYDSYAYSPSTPQRDFTNPFVSSKHLIIDRSALQIYGAAQDNTPPPYEAVAATSNSRAIGRLKASASPSLSSTKESHVSVLVEFMPMMVETQMNSKGSRLEKLQQSLDQLLQNARISHLGLLRFLGYCVDQSNSRYVFLYQMPVDYFPFLQNPSDLLRELKPKPLVALLPSAEDYREKRVPNLETRFRLAYDLLMSALHLRSQNAVHGNINSSNVIFFPGRTDANNDESGLAPDLRRPYITSPARFSGDGPTPEPLSSAMYRHPEDKRSVEDDGAWAYDLYSLGLVLLEIGLWAPVGRLWKMKYDRSWFKHRVEDLYVKKLGPKCGSAYLQAVQLCLDAPNFHLSTQPMTDLGLRVPQIYHYPVLDLSDPDGTFSFSMNFLYTICKILWSCCRIDIFSAPPAEELDDCLPLALVPTPEPAPAQKYEAYQPAREPMKLDKKLPTLPADDWRAATEGKNPDKAAKKRTVKRIPTLDIPDDHLQEWNYSMMPRLSRLLQKILKDSSESCGVSLMMTGDSSETARTTICVTCASVKKVRSALKKHYNLGRDDWDLIVLRGDIERSKVPRRKRRTPAKTRPNGSNETPFRQRELNPCYQQRPLCGASIGAFQNEEHLPPVSYGGAVLVDGLPYGLTVHHMLEAPSDDEGPGEEGQDAPSRSAGNFARNTSATPNPDLMYTWCEDDPSEINLEFEISDREDGDDGSVSQGFETGYDEYWLSDEDSSDDDSIDGADNDDDDAASIGDTAGIEPGEEPRLLVTQPAIDDVHDDFFPSPEDRDDEHLASHSLGYVHASSGVRRWTRKGIKHEVDWALIKVDEARMDPRNIILDTSIPTLTRAGPRRAVPPQPIFLNQVARMEELGGLQVHCCGRTSGLQTGQISKAMTLVKLHGRHSFSTSFCVNGNFGAPGDSGAWVFDRSTGRVCGHVLAWSAKSSTTYISPMEVTFDDIARTLHTSLVSLPGAPAASPGYNHPHSSALAPAPAQYRYPPQQLPQDFGRLALGGAAGTPPIPPPRPHFPHHPQHPHPHYPQQPGYPRPPPPPPPPHPPGTHDPHGAVYRGPVPPIPSALLTGPRNIERQLA